GHYQLSDEELFIVTAASWFHDIGYLFDCKQHEAKGVDIATRFLEEHKVDPEVIVQIKGCILATMMPQRPEGLLQQIVCDADLFHLGSGSFKERNKLMRKEAEAFSCHEIDKNEWNMKTIGLLKSHHFHTAYCQKLL